MAQLVNIALTNEDGKVIKNIDTNFAPILTDAWSEGEEKYPWLTSIDEYGNTYLNERQAAHVVQELELLMQSSGLSNDIQQVIKHLKDIGTHELLAFYGD